MVLDLAMALSGPGDGGSMAKMMFLKNVPTTPYRLL